MPSHTSVSSDAQYGATTDVEQLIWLYQQQSDVPLFITGAWKLATTCNSARLTAAIATLIAQQPLFRSRCTLDNASQLVKTIDDVTRELITITHCSSWAAYTASPRLGLGHSDTTQPGRFEVVVCAEGLFLVIDLHWEIAAQLSLDALLEAITHIYEGHSYRIPTHDGYWLFPPQDEQRFTAPTLAPSSVNDTPAIAAQCFADISELIHEHQRDSPVAQLIDQLVLRFGQFCLDVTATNKATLLRVDSAGTHFARVVHGSTSATFSAVTDSAMMFSKVINVQRPVITVLIAGASDRLAQRANIIEEEAALPWSGLPADIVLIIKPSSDHVWEFILRSATPLGRYFSPFLLKRFTASAQTPSLHALKSSSNDTKQLASEERSAPNTPPLSNADIASIILEQFQQVLKAPEMSAHDDFFDFGGHSLLATRIIGHLLKQHDIELRFSDFFAHATAAALATTATLHQFDTNTTTDDSSTLPPTEVVSAPLALAQRSLWGAWKAHDYGTIFNLPFAMHFGQPVKEEVMHQAWLDVLTRHVGLRTLFLEQEDEVTQQVVSIESLTQPDFQWFWSSRESTSVTLEQEAAHRFDLSRELPLRVRFINTTDRAGSVLSLLVHHMAIDEWSLNTVIEDLIHAYHQRSANNAPEWSSKVPGFPAFAQQQGEVNSRHLAYWVDMLQGHQQRLELFSPSSHPIEDHDDQFGAGWLETKLGEERSQRIYSCARQHNASIFNVLYSAIVIALNRLGGCDDIVIGTSASGRTEPEFYQTVGYFTTMVANRHRLSNAATLRDIIADIRDTIAASEPYSDVPIDCIINALGRDPNEGLPFEAYIQIHAHNAMTGVLEDADGSRIPYRQINPDKMESMFDLQFEIMEDVINGEHSLRFIITYRQQRYSKVQAERISHAIETVIDQLLLAQGSDIRLSALSLLN